MNTSQLTITPSHMGDVSTRVDTWECAEVSPQDIWRAVLGVASAVRAGDDKRELIKLTVGGEVLTDPALLPAADGSESQHRWLSRIQHEFGARTPVLLYARELPAHDRRLFELLLSAFGSVFAAHGLVCGNIDIEMFLGEYRATPRGIHREQCGNSHFVLEGRKYMHFWHGDDWIPESTDRQAADGENAIDPEEYLPSLTVPSVIDRGTSLIASAGEFFTWDPGTWHVAETVGPAFAFNIARYTKSFVPGEGTYPYAADPDGHVTSEWLSGYQDFLGGASPASALASASAYGMAGAAPDRVVPAIPRTVVVNSHGPLLWHSSHDIVLVATHGQCRAFPTAVLPWLPEVSQLAPGAEQKVPEDQTIHELARFLTTNGALRIPDEPTA